MQTEQPQQSKPTKLDPQPGALTIEDCPDHAHVAPNICFRSPLFGVCDQRKHLSVMDLPVATMNDKEVSYSGFRLSQSDLDIFIHLIRLARERQDETGWGQCSMYEILKATGRCKGKNPRQAVMMTMKRLTASALSITFTEPKTKRRYSYFGPMVHDFLFDHEAETYRFRINTHVAELFDFGWTKIEWELRLALKGDLAKWLHGYYASSHKKVYPLTVEKIRSLCGSGISQLKVFRARLKVALEAIKQAGAIIAWHIDKEDRVVVEIAHQSPERDPDTTAPEDHLPPEPTPAPVLPEPAHDRQANQGGANNTGTKPKKQVVRPPPQRPSSPPVISIPLVGGSREFAVFQEDIDQWQETFPGIDVLQSLRHIRQWNLDNPKRRKTANGIRRHITIWLGRDQDKGANLHGGKNANLSPTKKQDFPPISYI